MFAMGPKFSTLSMVMESCKSCERSTPDPHLKLKTTAHDSAYYIAKKSC